VPPKTGHLIQTDGGNNMYEYVTGKAMWANITSPNTRFQPHKYGLTVLTDADTASKLEGLGLNQVRDRAGQPKYDEPAFTFSKRATRNDGTANAAPKLVDTDGNDLDVSVGNGSEVVVKIKPYKNDYGQFAELMAVKVENLIEYVEGDTDNEEF
jgi:antitoxin component of MazEF toxin-antitoxin module